MRRPDWLDTESEAWQRDGLITPEQRREILARYPPSSSSSDRAAAALTWLAILAAGIGAIVIVAWNWTSIPVVVKVLLSSGPMVGLFALSYLAVRSGRVVRAERFALAASIFAGAVLFLTEDLVHIDPQQTSTALLWSAVLAASAVLVPSFLIAAVGSAVAVWWSLSNGGNGSLVWWFAAVWPWLALAIERRPNRFVAGGVTIALVAWVFLALITVWPDFAVVPALGALLAATWVDALAQLPSDQRPVFARTTPALSLALMALLMLLPAATHKTIPDWRVAGGSPVPAAALLLLLITSIVWTSRRSGVWRSRPLALTALVTGWLLAWLLLPAELRSAAWVSWSCTIAFSAATILTGANVVREAARTRDVAQFGIGLAMVIAFVIVRVVDAQNFIVSGLMLLVSALGLWWLARVWTNREPAAESTTAVVPARSPFSAPVLSARSVLVAAMFAIALTATHAVYRWWPTAYGTEILMPAALFKQPLGLNLVQVQLPVSRLEIDVPPSGQALSEPFERHEAFETARRVGDWWQVNRDVPINARVLRGRRLFVQLTPGLTSVLGGPSEMRADTVSDQLVAGQLNIAGRVVRVREDGYLWLDYSIGWIAVPADVAARARSIDGRDGAPPRATLRPIPPAADPGVYAVLRLLPSGRASLTGLIVNGTRY